MGGGVGPNFQLLMLSPNLLKSQIPFMVGGGGAPTFKSQLQTYKPKSQAEISIFFGGGAGNSTSAHCTMGFGAAT